MTWLTWALLSAVFAAATAILAKLGVQDMDSNLATAIRTPVVLVFAWLFAYSTWQSSALAAISPKTWMFPGLSGLATGLSWICYFHALKLGQPPTDWARENSYNVLTADSDFVAMFDKSGSPPKLIHTSRSLSSIGASERHFACPLVSKSLLQIESMDSGCGFSQESIADFYPRLRKGCSE